MKAKLYLFILVLLTGFLLDSCKSDNPTPVPTASFTASKTTALVSEEVIFTNASVNSTSFVWSFGDGTTSKEISPKKSWPVAGVYEVSMVASGAGGSMIATTLITVVPPPALYYIDPSVSLIRKVSIDGTNILSDVLDVAGQEGPGLAYDSVHGKIYYSDYNTTGAGKIWRMNLDATGLEAIVTGIADDPYGVSLDVAGGHVYWADGGGHISRANLDGSGKVDLITPTDIVDAQFRSNVGLDLTNHKMYFIDWWNEYVYKADLDGSNPVQIASTYGYAVLVDEVHSKLYFDDHYAGALIMSDLDGNNPTPVDQTGGRIYGIAMDPTINKLYWSNYSEGTLNVADPDGANKQILRSGLDGPRGIFVSK